MIEQYKIIEKATELLRDATDLEGVIIRQSEALNMNPEHCPWIGVYPDNEQFDPAYIGGIDSWEREINFRVHIQVANARDGESLEQTITEYMKAVMGAVYANHSEWAGLLDRFTQIRIEHGFQADDDGTMMFRESVVIFVGTVASGVQ